MRNDFGVAMGGEAMALRFQLGLHFGVVEEFAVEDDGDAAIFVEDRLPAVGEADDAEAPRGEGQTGPFEEAVLIRSAMNDGVGHRLRSRPPAPVAVSRTDR